MKKISIIGANGRIGREVIKYLYNGINNEAEIILITSEKETTINQLKVFLLDFENSLFLASSNIKSIGFKITQDYSLINNSDLIIMLASKIPTPEEKLNFKKIDETGRLANCKVNLDLINYTGEQIKKFAPNSVVVMVTNQVDIMCKITRKILGKEQIVIGIGNSIDSARFRFCLFNILREKTCNIKASDIEAYIIGYHNNSMFLLKDSLKIKSEFLNQKEIETCLIETKKMGSYISKLGRTDPQFTTQISGAFLSPAKAVVELVLAYLGESKGLKSVFNVLINDKKIADFYGLELYSEVAIPVLINKSKIEFIINYKISSKEKETLKNAQKELKESLAKLEFSI